MAAFKKGESEAKAVLEENKEDEGLSGDDLMKLLRWKMASGSSKLTAKAARLTKWKEVKSLPDPLAPEVPELSGLPFTEELARIKSRMAVRAAADAAAAAAAAITPAAPAPRAAFDLEEATLADLDAEMKVLAAKRARLLRAAANAASVGTGNAAAVVMAAAIDLTWG